ncbi:MAG TPA: hypothetical protein VK279_09850 [Solirubrobacteraceae bacterium]|nr:hypothetical protein [Solirubrobacteraceae bacterium]
MPHRRRGRRDRRRAIVIAGQVIEDGWSVLIGLVALLVLLQPKIKITGPASSPPPPPRSE